MAVAATMAARVLGAVPINPTIPWFDPLARSVSSREAAMGYRLLKYLPWVLPLLVAGSTDRARKLKSNAPPNDGGFNKADLIGPPPGTEQDIEAFQWRVMERSNNKQALLSDIQWATADWGFDYYAIAAKLDLFCGAYDAQAPFALVLADRNPDARFHYFPFGHSGYSHPDARHRIFDTISGYFDS